MRRDPGRGLEYRTSILMAAAVLLGAQLIWSPDVGAALEPNRTGDWPPLTKIEKSIEEVESEPGASAVLLRKERNGRFFKRADDWVNVLDYHWRLKVLTDEGKKFAEVVIPGHKYSRVSNIRARTIKPDGTIVPVDEGQIFERVYYRGSGYYRYSEWTFSFPAVEPGAILEYMYDRHDNYILYVRPFYLAGTTFTLRSRVTQAIPEEMGYSILCGRCPEGSQPDIEFWHEGKSEGKRYVLELENLEGYHEELMMPPRREISPRLEMILHNWEGGRWSEALARQDDFFTDWESVGRFADYYYEEAIRDGRSEVRRLVREWVSEERSEQEKIETVFRHVQEDFDYIEWNYVVGYTRSLDTVIEEKAADNEEKAVLLSAALESIGIDTRLALVVGKHVGSLSPEFFSMSQFTHVVVGVPNEEGRYEWLDPTVSNAPYGLVSWKNSGAAALLIAKSGSELIELPKKNERNRTEYTVTVKPSLDGKARLLVEAEYQGEDAVDMRNGLVPMSDELRRTFVVRWLEERLPAGVLQSFGFENMDDRDEPLLMKLETETTGLVTLADDVILVKGCVLSCYDSNPLKLKDRRHPLYIDRGWDTRETVIIEPPPGLRALEVPPAGRIRSRAASLTFRCTSSLEGEVTCKRVFVARRNHYPLSEITLVRDMFDRIVQSDRTSVAFSHEQAAELH